MEKIKKYIKKLTRKQKQTGILLGLFVLFGVYLFFHHSPKDFPIGQVVTVNPGQSLQSITNELYKTHVIKWPFLFRSTVIILGGEKRVIAGDYFLDHKEGPADLAYRLVHGEFRLETVKVTIPEGWTISQIGDYLEKNLIHFNKKKFLSLAKGEEGYLFPDTYFISQYTTPETIISMMKSLFEKKVLSIPGITTGSHKLGDIITMASILEEEARTTESRKLIAGILWKRLSIGMPLQVDSTFLYINGKNTYELTKDDLQIDSPYNTYVYKGLPKGPIGNPGLDAIMAAFEPTKTSYLYYLSSRDGTMHYAKTFDEHKLNRVKYL